jgi:hypothetical protein
VSIPRVPATAGELEAAIRDGILEESLHFDAKAELEPVPKGNRALAVDMAAMAVDGGLIGIGIAEERSKGAKVHVPTPVALAGLRERVSQVGLSRVDPPLTVVTRELPRDDSGSGYLLILVPPSPDAPHMVDGQYRGVATPRTTSWATPKSGACRRNAAEFALTSGPNSSAPWRPTRRRPNYGRRRTCSFLYDP